jgi:hypothetical protein
VSIINSSPTQQATINRQRREANSSNGVFEDGKMSNVISYDDGGVVLILFFFFVLSGTRNLYSWKDVLWKGFSSSDASE